MIFKTKDSVDKQLEELDRAIRGERLDSKRRALEKERALMLAGLAGEKEAAYHIDFDLKDSRNWAIIHDLRLEWNGRVAQIDHLIIDRVLELYVVESKNFRTKVRYANGGWERLNGRNWEGIPSPVEQNERHILVLKELIAANKLGPTRMGLPIPLDFYNCVLVNPSCSIVGKYPRHVRIYKMDSFVRAIRDEDPSVLYPLKIVSAKTVEEFALRLVAHHKPVRQAAAVAEMAPPYVTQSVETKKSSAACGECGGEVTNAEAYFCRINKARFGGAVLCRKCQSYAPAETKAAQHVVAARCAECGAGVDKKVVAFSRFNSKKLGGKILCRECQPQSQSNGIVKSRLQADGRL